MSRNSILTIGAGEATSNLRMGAVRRLLSEVKVANLATSNPEGAPHLVPISFIHNDGKLYFTSRMHSTKCKNILQNNRVALSIIGAETVVLIQGTATVLGPLQTYLTPELARTFLKKYSRKRRTSSDSVLVRVHPVKVLAGRLGRRQRRIEFN